MAEAEARERYGVIGFVPDEVAERLRGGDYSEDLKLRAERGSDEVQLVVRAGDVESVRVGPSESGETGVQVVLQDDHRVERIVNSKLVLQGAQRFVDPTLNPIAPRGIITVIMA